MYDFDLIVIGGGSGGVRAARIAAGHGAKVAICEEYRYGGTCVIRGCVPKKLMVYASHYHEEFIDAESFGWQLESPTFDWSTLIANKDREIDRLNGIYETLLKNTGVTAFYGRGVLKDPHTVEVAGEVYSAAKVLIATGGAPVLPDIPGIEHGITSNEIFHLAQQPRDVVIVGGGFIAVEFAGILHGMGSRVHLVYRGDQLLRGFDGAVRQHLTQELIKKGMKVSLETNVTAIEAAEPSAYGEPSAQKEPSAPSKHKVHFDSGESQRADCVLFATGRRPNTSSLGLEAAGIQLNHKGAIQVDETSRSSVESVFAVGDVTDRIALTPVATMEGHAFADSEFGGQPRLADHKNVPAAVFSQPPVAAVGLGEEEARTEFANIDTYTSTFRVLKHTLTPNTERTLIKLVVDADTDKVVGAHMVGPDAAEIMQGIAIAVKAGATKADFNSTVGIHPSTAEEFCTLRTKDA